MKNIPSELKDIAPQWYRVLVRAADFSKLKTLPNDKLNMNDFRYCIIGESHGEIIGYIPKHEKFCDTCFRFSYKISEEYHTLADTNGRNLDKFNRILTDYIKHFKSQHKNK